MLWVYALAGTPQGMTMGSVSRGKPPPLPAHLRSVLTPPRANSGRHTSADALPCAELGASGAAAPHLSGSAGHDGWDASDKIGVMLGYTACAPALSAHAPAEGLHAALQQQAVLLRPAAAASKHQVWLLHTNVMGNDMHLSATWKEWHGACAACGRHVVL